MSNFEANQGSGDNGQGKKKAVMPQPSRTTSLDPNFNPLATSFSLDSSGPMQATDAAHRIEPQSKAVPFSPEHIVTPLLDVLSLTTADVRVPASVDFVPGHHPAQQTNHNHQYAPEAGREPLPFSPAPGASRRRSPRNLARGASHGPSPSRLSPTAASFNPSSGAPPVDDPLGLLSARPLQRFPSPQPPRSPPELDNPPGATPYHIPPAAGHWRSFSDVTHGGRQGSPSARQSNCIISPVPGPNVDFPIRHADQTRSEKKGERAGRKGKPKPTNPGQPTNLGQPTNPGQPTNTGQPTNPGQSAVLPAWMFHDGYSGNFENVVQDGQMGSQGYYPPSYHFNDHNWPGGRQYVRPNTPPEVVFNEEDDQAFIPFVPDVPDPAPPPAPKVIDEDNRKRR